MKKTYYLSLIILLSSKALLSQDSLTVEKQIFGIQAGLLGVWVHGEFKIADPVSLRVEAGYNYYFGIYNNDASYLAVPVISVEPRYYSNLKSRAEQGKSIRNNSGIYISLNTKYIASEPAIMNSNTITVPIIRSIPSIGFRYCKNHFSYETATGIGYEYSFDGNRSRGRGALNFTMRVGYNF